MKQCTRLIVKTPCKVFPAKGKPWTLRAGAIFLLQGKSGFRVEVPALAEQTQEVKESVTA